MRTPVSIFVILILPITWESDYLHFTFGEDFLVEVDTVLYSCLSIDNNVLLCGNLVVISQWRSFVSRLPSFSSKFGALSTPLGEQTFSLEYSSSLWQRIPDDSTWDYYLDYSNFRSLEAVLELLGGQGDSPSPNTLQWAVLTAPRCRPTHYFS